MNHSAHPWRHPRHNWMSAQRGQRRHNASRSARRNAKWLYASLKKGDPERPPK